MRRVETGDVVRARCTGGTYRLLSVTRIGNILVSRGEYLGGAGIPHKSFGFNLGNTTSLTHLEDTRVWERVSPFEEFILETLGEAVEEVI